MEDKLYMINDLSQRLGLSVSAIHSHLARKNYKAVPVPIYVGRRLAWPKSVVDEWIEAKMELARKQKEALDELMHALKHHPLGRPKKTRGGR